MLLAERARSWPRHVEVHADKQVPKQVDSAMCEVYEGGGAAHDPSRIGRSGLGPDRPDQIPTTVSCAANGGLRD